MKTSSVLPALFIALSLAAASAAEPPELLNQANIHYDASAVDTLTFTVEGGVTNVTGWKNLGVNGETNNALLPEGFLAPQYKGGMLDFGATGSKMDLAFGGMSGIKTVFWVIDIELHEFAFLLGDVGKGSTDFHRGPGGEYVARQWGSADVCDGSFRMNGADVADPTAEKIPERLRVISFAAPDASAGLYADSLTQDRNFGGRNGGRRLAELAVFDRILSDAERRGIEEHLAAKWAVFRPRWMRAEARRDAAEAAVELAGEAGPGAPVGIFLAAAGEDVWTAGTNIASGVCDASGGFSLEWKVPEGWQGRDVLLGIVSSNGTEELRGEILAAALPAGGNAVTAAGKKRKALVVVWDGCRGDVASKPGLTPNLHALAAAGVCSWKAFAGGVKGAATETATVTGPGFHNIFTGVWGNKHGVVSDSSDNIPDYASYPTFFKRLKDATAGRLYMAGYFGWKKIYDAWLAREGDRFDLLRAADHVEDLYQQEAADVLEKNGALDLFFFECWEPDSAAKGSSFSQNAPDYTRKIKELDAKLGELVAAVRARPSYADEEWLVIVTADHGGIGKTHGGQSDEERWVPLVAAGPGIPAGTLCEPGPGHTAVCPTLLRHFNVTIDPAWGLEAVPFGNGETGPGGFAVIGKDRVSRRVTLGWVPAFHDDGWTVTVTSDAAGVSAATNGAAGSLSWEHPWTTDAVPYRAVAEKAGLPPVTNAFSVALPPPEIPCSPLVRGLDTYLDADGTAGQAFDVPRAPASVCRRDRFTAPGAPVYTDDCGRRAFHFDGTWWMNLGQYPAMNTNSFTVSFWFNPQVEREESPVFLGTQNWYNGNNTGWDILARTYYNSHYLNFGLGDRRNGVNFNFERNVWVHLTAVFDRGRGAVTLYENGVFGGETAFGPAPGAVWCENDFTLGCSGAKENNGTDEYFGQSYLDDVAVWNRALTGPEAASVYGRYAGALDALDAGAGFALGETSFSQEGGRMTVSVPVLLKAGHGPAALALYLADRDYGPDATAWPEGARADAGTVSRSGKVSCTKTIAAGDKQAVARWAAENGAGRTVLSEPQIHLTDAGYRALGEGLTHYLPLDGDTLNLVAGEIQPARGEAAYTAADSVSGSAALFNGDWFFSLGRPDNVGAGSFSFGLWLKNRGGDGDEVVAVGTADWYTRRDRGFVFSTPGKYEEFTWSTTGNNYDCLEGWQEKDAWIYVLTVFDRGNGTVTLYKNGVKAGEKRWATDGGGDGFSFLADGMNFNFGASGSGEYKSRSLQDEVAVWSRPLSEEEVRAVGVAKGHLRKAVRGAFFLYPRLDETDKGFAFSGELHAYNVEVEEAGIVYGPDDLGGDFAAWDGAARVSAAPAPGAERQTVSFAVECGRDRPVYARPYITYGGATRLGGAMAVLPRRRKADLLRDLHIYLPLENHALNLAESGAAVTPSAHDGAEPKPAYNVSWANRGRMAFFSKDTWFIDAGSPPFLATNDFTVSLWLYGPETFDGGFMGTQDWKSGGNPGWALAHWNGPAYFNFVSNDRHKYLFDEGGLVKEWAYYTISVNRADRIIEIYVNGNQVGRFTGDDVDSASERHDVLPHSLRIGAPQGDRGWQRRSMQDEVAIWSRALSREEAAELYFGMRGILADGIEAVSFDFQTPGSADPLDDGAYYGAFPCKGRYWNRISDSRLDRAKGWVDNAGFDTGSFRLSCKGLAVGPQVTTEKGYDPLLQGQLTDINGEACFLTFENVPYEAYDLYLYKGSGESDADAGWDTFSPVLLDGKYYKPDERGFAAECGPADGWGDSYARRVKPGAAGNVMIFTNLTGNVTVRLPRNEAEQQRASVPAFQIVNRGRPSWVIHPRGTAIILR